MLVIIAWLILSSSRFSYWFSIFGTNDASTEDVEPEEENVNEPVVDEPVVDEEETTGDAEDEEVGEEEGGYVIDKPFAEMSLHLLMQAHPAICCCGSSKETARSWRNL